MESVPQTEPKSLPRHKCFSLSQDPAGAEQCISLLARVRLLLSEERTFTSLNFY